MKLIAVSAMSAVAMANDLEAIWKAALAKPSSIEALNVNQQMMRSAGDDRNVMDLFTLSNIFEYGCWCHFGNSPLPRGPVQDTVDGYCNTWWNSKDCIRIDAQNAQPARTCDLSMQYNDVLAGLSFPFSPQNDYDALCQNANQAADFGGNADDAQCAMENCRVDAYFLRDTFTHMSFNNLNVSLSMSFGFDTDSVCRGIDVGATTQAPFAGTTAAPLVHTTEPAATTATPLPTWDCCGTFPNRFPYRPANGKRACCSGAAGANTYNPLTLTCCASGATAALGTTC